MSAMGHALGRVMAACLAAAACAPAPGPRDARLVQICDEDGCALRDPALGPGRPRPRPVAAGDPAHTMPQLSKAAEDGVPEAQYDLGLRLYRGEGVRRDLYAALQWFRRAAEAGYLPAQRTVGRIYMTGLDTMGQDLQEARTWLAAAASRGDAPSRRWLAEIDRAASQQAEQERVLQAQAAQTATFLAAAMFAAAIRPPPVVVVY